MDPSPTDWEDGDRPRDKDLPWDLYPPLRTESTSADLAVREVICDAIDALDPLERFIMERYFIERLTLKEIGLMTGRSLSTVHRIRDGATARLREVLEVEPLVRERLN